MISFKNLYILILLVYLFASVSRFFFTTRIQINVSWSGSGSGQMILIQPDPDPKHSYRCSRLGLHLDKLIWCFTCKWYRDHVILVIRLFKRNSRWFSRLKYPFLCPPPSPPTLLPFKCFTHFFLFVLSISIILWWNNVALLSICKNTFLSSVVYFSLSMDFNKTVNDNVIVRIKISLSNIHERAIQKFT